MGEHLVTALIVRKGVAQWTTLHIKKGQAEVADQQKVPLELPAGVTDPYAPDVAAQIKLKCVGLHGRLTVAVPSDQVLMRVTQMPSADAAELRSMAELQVDKFSPFPIDQMAVAVEVLQQKDSSSRALIVAIQREHIDKLGGLLTAAGLAPQEIDVDVLGWWKLLQDHGEVSSTGREILLVIDEHCTELIVIQDGAPLVFRALGSHSHLSPVESATEIADEINYTLTTLEGEWGAAPSVPLKVWHWDASPEEFLAQLRQAAGNEVVSRHLETLSPLSEGLAKRAAARSPLMVDLAPSHWRESVKQKKTRKILITAVAACLGVWFIGVCAFLIGLKIQNSRLAKMKAEVEQLKGPANEVMQLDAQIKSLSRYTDTTYSSIEILLEISTLLPPGVDLTSITYKKYGQVNLRGESDSSDPIYEFFKAMEKSKLFIEIKPEGVTDQIRGGQRKSQFRMTATLPEEKT